MPSTSEIKLSPKIKKPDSFRAETVSSSIELGTPNDIASEPQREELV